MSDVSQLVLIFPVLVGQSASYTGSQNLNMIPCKSPWTTGV